MPTKKEVLDNLKLHISLGHINKFKRLFAAVKEEKSEWVKDFLSGEEDGGCGLLHQAAMSSNGAEFIKYLVDKEEAAVNQQDYKGRTPLLFACDRGYEDNVTALLDRRANPSIAEYTTQNSLHIAAHGENEQIIEKLLKSGADIKACTESGATAVHFAAQHSLAALHALYKFKPKEFKELLTSKDAEGDTPLHYAAYGSGKCAKFLIFLGADKDAKNKDEETPYDVAEDWECGGEAAKIISEFDHVIRPYDNFEDFYTWLIGDSS